MIRGIETKSRSAIIRLSAKCINIYQSLFEWPKKAKVYLGLKQENVLITCRQQSAKQDDDDSWLT